MSPSHQHADPFANCAQVVAALAHDLSVPREEVEGIYRGELARLIPQARVGQFVVTLAVRNTRSILRQRNPSGASGRGGG